MCVQYIRGCSVHRGDIMSTSGGYHEDIISTSADTMSTLGDIMSTSGDTQYIGGCHEYVRGYHEYIRGCSVHWGDLMMHVGEQVNKSLSISIENPDVLNIPDVLMMSP